MRLNFGSIDPSITKKIGPFFEQSLEASAKKITSVTLVGSALGDDFVPKRSDINSVFVLDKMDFDVIKTLAHLGKKHKKHGVAAPLLMTTEYIQSSTDVFPVEFLSYKVLHQTLIGDDPFTDLDLKLADLRQQCERELKAKLIGLRQGYLATLGDPKYLLDHMEGLLPAMVPIFRAFLFLKSEVPERGFSQTIERLEKSISVNLSVFSDLLATRRGNQALPKASADEVFERFYQTTDQLGRICDEMEL